VRLDVRDVRPREQLVESRSGCLDETKSRAHGDAPLPHAVSRDSGFRRASDANDARLNICQRCPRISVDDRRMMAV